MVKINFKQTFTALRHRNYRLWFIGQITSLFGSWMQRTAETFLIFELTRSPVYLGYVGFANGLPSWLFMLYGGVVADRIPRRTILIVTQTVMMILAFILAFLTLTGAVTPWSVIVLAFGLGVANAFDAPARQAFVLELIDREDLINAIALNATMFNGATAVGPAIAGFTYAAFGPAWCFMINGISFIGVIAALFMMKLKPMEKNLSRKSPLAELKEGFAYLKDKRLIQLLMAFTMITATFGLSLVTLMPAWAVKVLHGGASTNGLLQSARGAGALVSALFLATISRKKIKGKLITTGSFAFGIFMFIFSWVSWL
ncbi:MAG TPA: MFS transporter, partial [Ignavibacteriales bacterium]|nr:MFS transporter [Ignavibacteriales bacterium]